MKKLISKSNLVSEISEDCTDDDDDDDEALFRQLIIQLAINNPITRMEKNGTSTTSGDGIAGERILYSLFFSFKYS